MHSLPEPEAETKWKSVGDRALAVWRFDLAWECFEHTNDLNALMLLLLVTGDRIELGKLANQAEAKGLERRCVRVQATAGRNGEVRGSADQDWESTRGCAVRSDLCTIVSN